MIRELVCLAVGVLLGYVIGLNKEMVYIHDARQRSLWDDRRIY